MFSPLMSLSQPSHYLMFMEMITLPIDQLPKPDQNQTFFQSKPPADTGLGRCPRCPSYSFSSKADKLYHCQVMHRMPAKQSIALVCDGSAEYQH